MHSFDWFDEETHELLTVHHNGDFSGYVRVEVPSAMEYVTKRRVPNYSVPVKADEEHPAETVYTIQLPAEMLVEFARKAVTDVMISYLETLRELPTKDFLRG